MVTKLVSFGPFDFHAPSIVPETGFDFFKGGRTGTL